MDLELDRVAVEAEALRATRRACELFLESPETRAAFERVRGGDAVPPAVAFACRLALLAAGIGSPDDAVVGESASREATSSGYDGFERVDDGAFSFTFTSSSSSVSAAAAADPSAGSDPLARGDRGSRFPASARGGERAAAEDEASLARRARSFARRQGGGRPRGGGGGDGRPRRGRRREVVGVRFAAREPRGAEGGVGARARGGGNAARGEGGGGGGGGGEARAAKKRMRVLERSSLIRSTSSISWDE